MLIKKIATRPISVDDRKGIIGGSSVGALLDLKGYGTEFEVYLDYIGKKPEPDEKIKWTFKRGHILEKANAEMFTALTGFDLTEPQEAYYDPDHPYLILHPDREFIDPKTGDKYALECKMASIHAFRHSWGDSEDQVSAPLLDPSIIVYRGDENSLIEQYYAQTQWYYALADYKGVFLARLTDNDIAIYFVEPDKQVQEALYYTAIEFHDKVESGWTPVPKNTHQAKTINPVCEKDSEITADDEVEDLMRKLRAIKDEQKELEAEEEIVKTDIMNFMKNKEVLVSSDGERLATWKKVRKSNFDSGRFKADYPNLYESYMVRGETRSFKLSK